MSEHLRHTEPFISANEGWKSMQGLLDVHLPVTPTRKHRVTILFACLVCLLCFFISFKLDTGYLPVTLIQSTFHQPLQARIITRETKITGSKKHTFETEGTIGSQE